MNHSIAAAANRTFAALRFRNYRLYLSSQIISFSGTWMQQIAQAWLVLELTGSGTALGTIAAAQFIPTLIFAPFGGIVADRFDKRRLIMATQGTAGVLALLMGILTLTDQIELWMIYVIAAGFGAVTAVDNPSRQTFVMEMVGPDEISNAVTLNSVVVNAARAIGPAVGGILIATVGVGLCFVFNAVSYLAVILALSLVNRADLHPAARAGRHSGQLREGFTYMWRTPILRTTIIMLVIMGTLSYEFNVILPMMAEFVFESGPGGLAALTAIMGGGAVIGGLIVAAAGPPTPRRLIVLSVCFGLSLFLLAWAPTITVAFIVMPLVGATNVAIIALSNATLQLNSDPKLRGRIMSMFSMALIGSTPIGGPIVGWIGDHIDPRVAVGVGAAAAIVAGLYGWRAQRNFLPNINTPRPAEQVVRGPAPHPVAPVSPS